jgi:hypothetical protein
MSETTIAHITLARPRVLRSRMESCLSKLPVIHSNIEQISSELCNKFKYLQNDSPVCHKWRIEETRERMTETKISHGGKHDAC